MLALFMICIVCFFHAHAQFMRLQLIIEDEIFIADVRIFQTDIIPANYGWYQISPDDEYAGRVTIRTAENINLYVSVQSPGELVLDANNKIPFVLEAAFLNTGNMDFSQAIAFDGNEACFPINNNGLLVEHMPASKIPVEATLLFYGSLYVGMVDPGVYHGVVKVSIEY